MRFRFILLPLCFPVVERHGDREAAILGAPRENPPANRKLIGVVACCPGQEPWAMRHVRCSGSAFTYTIAVRWWCQCIFSGGGPKNYRARDSGQISLEIHAKTSLFR